MFIPEFETFTDARTKCKRMTENSDLVIIETAQENEFLMNVTQGGDWWIGKKSFS